MQSRMIRGNGISTVMAIATDCSLIWKSKRPARHAPETEVLNAKHGIIYSIAKSKVVERLLRVMRCRFFL